MRLGALLLAALAVLVLVLAPGPADGRTVGRCELKKALGDAFHLYVSPRFKDYLLAKVISCLERISHLNTSLVRVFSQESENEEDDYSEDDDERPHMYFGLHGVFQLRDNFHCQSGVRTSRNYCQKDCSDFANDDITDDIICFVRSETWRQIFYISCGYEQGIQYILSQCGE